MPKVRVQRRERETTCPLCREQLSEDAFECECGVRYHAACVSELGGKCVPGCERELGASPVAAYNAWKRAFKPSAGPDRGRSPSPNETRIQTSCKLAFSRTES